MKKYIAILMAIACAAALLLTGCGQNNDPQPDPQPSGLTGSVATDGSTSMQKVINTLGEAFMNENKHRLTRAHREKQLKMSCQALHNAPPNRT